MKLKLKMMAASVVVGMAFAASARNLEASKVDSRYFADSEGKTFVPVGCNICFPRMYDEDFPRLAPPPPVLLTSASRACTTRIRPVPALNARSFRLSTNKVV